MRPFQVEGWALDIMDRLTAGQPLEDSRVELKTEWPQDMNKAARRLGGHANAARGEPILWLIGADERSRQIVGAEYQEFPAWYSRISSEFDGLAPSVLDINVPLPNLQKTLVALLFDTDRAPFVVRNPRYGVSSGEVIAHEVPWREGTRVRSATRADLLRLLVPMTTLPEVELWRAELDALQFGGDEPGILWTLNINLYVVPGSQEPVVLPYHHSIARIAVPGYGDSIALQFYKPRIDARPSVQYTDRETMISGAGELWLTARGSSDLPETAAAQMPQTPANITVTLRPIRSQAAVTVAASLPYRGRPVEGLHSAGWHMDHTNAGFG